MALSGNGTVHAWVGQNAFRRNGPGLRLQAYPPHQHILYTLRTTQSSVKIASEDATQAWFGSRPSSPWPCRWSVV